MERKRTLINERLPRRDSAFCDTSRTVIKVCLVLELLKLSCCVIAPKRAETVLRTRPCQ